MRGRKGGSAKELCKWYARGETSFFVSISDKFYSHRRHATEGTHVERQIPDGLLALSFLEKGWVDGIRHS